MFALLSLVNIKSVYCNCWTHHVFFIIAGYDSSAACRFLLKRFPLLQMAVSYVRLSFKSSGLHLNSVHYVILNRSTDYQLIRCPNSHRIGIFLLYCWYMFLSFFLFFFIMIIICMHLQPISIKRQWKSVPARQQMQTSDT